MHFIFLFLGSKYLCDPFPWILTNTTCNRVSLNWEFVWQAAAKIINKLVHMTPELKCTVIILSGSLKPHNVLPIHSWYDKLDGKIIVHCVFFPLACLWVMLHLFVRDLSQYWPEVSPEEAAAVLPPNRSICFTRSLCSEKGEVLYNVFFLFWVFLLFDSYCIHINMFSFIYFAGCIFQDALTSHMMVWYPSLHNILL